MYSSCQASLDTPCLGGSDLQNHYGKLSNVAHVANEMHKHANKNKKSALFSQLSAAEYCICMMGREKDEKWSDYSLPGSLEQMPNCLTQFNLDLTY